MELERDQSRAKIVDFCETEFATQADATVAMVRMSTTVTWRVNLAESRLTHEQLVTFASANPAAIEEQNQQSKQHLETLGEEFRSCFTDIETLPKGDMKAAQMAVAQILQTASQSRGPLAGVNLQVLPWVTDVDKGLQRAAKEQKHAILFFDATWCAPCTLLKKLFRDPTVVKAMEHRFVVILVDVSNVTDADAAIQKRFRAESLPALLVLDSRGAEIARYTAKSPSKDELLSFIRSVDGSK